MTKRIDINEWKESYKKGAVASGEKWKKEFLATSGIAAAASSEEAQNNYVAMMSDPGVLAKRQARLQGLSDEDFKRPVREGGASLYTRGVSAKVDKAAEGFAPYATVINDVVAGLPPRTTDPVDNVNNRVIPIVQALYDKAREG